MTAPGPMTLEEWAKEAREMLERVTEHLPKDKIGIVLQIAQLIDCYPSKEQPR